jgi:hypothetical protein
MKLLRPLACSITERRKTRRGDSAGSFVVSPCRARRIINPVLDYDFGHNFNAVDGSGVWTLVRPCIKQGVRLLGVRHGGAGRGYRRSASTSIAGIMPHCRELALRATCGLMHRSKATRNGAPVVA